MPRPGTTVTLIDTPGTVSIPTDTSTWFAVGLTDRGPTTPKLVLSLDQFVTIFGTRQTYSVLYDSVEEFFREGGNECYITRVVGPSATVGTRNLLDAGAGVSLVVSAIGPGAWSANYKVAVYAATGGYGIQVLDTANNVLEDSGALVDQNSAVQWANTSNYIRIALGATALVPAVVAATALSAGADDRLNITDTQWLNALNTFTSDLGPGQVSAPGQTTATRYSQLINHANLNNRVAIIDLTDSGSSSTLTGALPAKNTSTRMVAAFAPWVVIPPTGVGTTRVVPPSAMVAGLIAANDPVNGANSPAAGKNGISNYVVGLSQAAWDDATRSVLNNAGVNVIRNLGGSIRVYGWRSLADPVADQNWLGFGNSRLYVELVAELQAVAENFVFEEIDGQNGVTVNTFHDALAAVLNEHWNSRRDLFGDTPDSAFFVDTGPTVNTLATIAALELHATIQVRMSPMAEWVQLKVVKRQTTDAIVGV